MSNNLMSTFSKILKFDYLKKYKVMLVDSAGKIIARFRMNSMPNDINRYLAKRVTMTDIIDMHQLINIKIVNY